MIMYLAVIYVKERYYRILHIPDEMSTMTNSSRMSSLVSAHFALFRKIQSRLPVFAWQRCGRLERWSLWEECNRLWSPCREPIRESIVMRRMSL